jgi:lipopolysaccharide export system permease protein
MPVLIAIGFFIVYFIISSTGEKLAQQGAVHPWYGMWLASAVLLPLLLSLWPLPAMILPFLIKKLMYGCG